MNEWLIVFGSAMITPLLMVGVGILMWKVPVRKVNHFLGYRTSMSKKNTDTWLFANTYCGRIWFFAGMVLSLITIVVMLGVMKKDGGTLEKILTVVILVQCTVMIVSIIPVEVALRTYFNKDGSRKW